MRNFLLVALLSLFVVGAYAQDNLAYAEGDYEGFTKDMRVSKKNYIVYYSADWCRPCKLFQNETLADADVSAYMKKNYALYKVDVDKNKELRKRYNVTAIPTTIVFDSNGKEIYRFNSFVPAKKFLRTLKMLN